VIGDRHPRVVREERRVRTQERSHARRVMARRVEIGVVADLGRQQHLDRGLRPQQVCAYGRALLQEVEDPPPELPALGGQQGHERVQALGGAGVGEASRDHVRGGAGGEVEHLVADGGADVGPVRGVAAEHAERQILHGKVGAGAIRRGHPAPALEVVCLVQRDHRNPASRRSAIGSRNEQEPKDR
jgi:hypothetical protein